jgi:hypothetical protein
MALLQIQIDIVSALLNHGAMFGQTYIDSRETASWPLNSKITGQIITRI